MRVLLLTPPMTQINSPYPATAYLTGYLRELGYDVQQRDLSLELILRLFSQTGLTRVRENLTSTNSETVEFFLEAFDDYVGTVEPVIRFLQNQDPSLALRIVARTVLPEGPRFIPLSEHPELLENFGEMGSHDKAKYLASLYLDDLIDVIKHGVDPSFEFSKYAEQLAAAQTSFEPLYTRLLQKPTLIDEMILEIVREWHAEIKPDVVGLSIPFPGNMYGGLLAGREFKKLGSCTVMGGGFINTELRELSDARVFDFTDYLIFDDGERPLQLLIEHLQNNLPKEKLFRTKARENGKVVTYSAKEEKDIAFKDLPGPTFKGLSLTEYISMLEMPNPMFRMWSGFRWNKMILAHGCYWKKCTFCDVSLDYIKRFEPARASDLVDQVERIIKETGQSGFHFVDEAAPPALLKAFSEEVIKRKLNITWWGNLRFDKQFTRELVELMKDAGCVAVTGGLEVASPRILKLINKGITIEQVREVTKTFKDAGIYVHAYLMYGFPSQTEKETIESLEVVRKLFADGCLHSAYWHRFVATAHSPVGMNPEKFQIELRYPKIPSYGLFARNEIPFSDLKGADHSRFSEGLRKAVYNYMHGIGLDQDVRGWFA